VTDGPTALPGPAPAPDPAELVAATVLAVPGVAGLHGGTFGTVGTYLPGRTVTGVRLRADAAEVHVVLFRGAPVLATADLIRAAIGHLVTGPVDVSVEDLVEELPVTVATAATTATAAPPSP
jgi:hypothetical protein